MTSFRVGQKVVCVDVSSFTWSDEDIREYGLSLPVLGSVYTVRAIREVSKEGPALLLKEIQNPRLFTTGGWIEIGFLMRRFRPVVERKTDISVFRAMLNPSKQKEPAA